MRIVLLAPEPRGAESGGHAYDRGMVAALRAGGTDAELRGFGDPAASGSPAGDAAACAAWDALAGDAASGDVLPIIDGLGLACFAARADALAASGAVALIHHPGASNPGRADPARRDAERRLLAAMPRIVATSDPVAARLAEEYGIARERIAVVVPGADDLPRSPGSGGPTCQVLAVGALTRRKGHDRLMEALARLFDLDWRLTIAGDAARDPECARALPDRAAALGISDRVTILPAPDATALEPAWRGADVFALATRWEGYPSAVAEALRRGLPVAVTDGGGAGTLVPPEAGTVCPVGDRDQLSKALRRLIFDAALRRDMAEAAWQAGQRLPGWPAQADAFLHALRAEPTA